MSLAPLQELIYIPEKWRVKFYILLIKQSYVITREGKEISKKKEIKITIKEVIGAQTPFWQGGSFRIILPRWFVRKYCQTRTREAIDGDSGLDKVPFVFIETDKGVLMMPIKELITDTDMSGKLAFSLSTRISEKEIERLINRKVGEE